MKELLTVLAQGLVDSPDEVVVTEIHSDQATVLQLRVAPEDLGQVIGKQGRTARSIRTLLSAAGRKSRKRLVLDIVE